MDRLSAHLDRGWELVTQGDLNGAMASAEQTLDLLPARFDRTDEPAAGPAASETAPPTDDFAWDVSAKGEESRPSVFKASGFNPYVEAAANPFSTFSLLSRRRSMSEVW